MRAHDFARGDRPTIVFLHGTRLTGAAWATQTEALADRFHCLAPDLPGHGRAAGTPFTLDSAAASVAELIEREAHGGRAIVVGLSLGGAVGLRTAIQHPDLVERLVLVSTVFKREGWHPEMRAGMDAMGPEMAGYLMQSPMYEAYRRIAPRVEDWPILVRQVTEVVKIDYDWSAEVRGLSMPVMLVIGDADGLPPSHAVEFFGLLGGGRRDAGWDRSGMTHHRLAILPGVTHYDINVVPALSAAVIPFLDSA